MNLLDPEAPVFPFVCSRHSVFYPFGRFGILQIIIKELPQPYGKIFTVLALNKVMVLSIVLKQPYFFSKAAQGGKVFDALVLGYGTICIVVHDNKWRVYFISCKQR